MLICWVILVSLMPSFLMVQSLLNIFLLFSWWNHNATKRVSVDKELDWDKQNCITLNYFSGSRTFFSSWNFKISILSCGPQNCFADHQNYILSIFNPTFDPKISFGLIKGFRGTIIGPGTVFWDKLEYLITIFFRVEGGAKVPVVKLNVRPPYLVFSEVNLFEAVELSRIPFEVVVVPGHPHPRVHREDGPALVDVEVDDGHPQLDDHSL